jgi:uncharacterized membrane protein
MIGAVLGTIGGYEARTRLVAEAATNVRAFLAGERRNRVD